MPSPKLPRKKALAALRNLISVRRPTLDDSPLEIFPYGWISAEFEDGVLKPKKRNAKEHRSIALVLAAVIDQVLEAAIASRLPGIVPENEGYIFTDDAAPLRDLDAKIRMGFALGIYGEQARSDLSLLRVVRNAFAHSRVDLHFDIPEVSDACSHFTLPVRAPTLMMMAWDKLADDYCQTFIDVGLQYALYLMPSDDDDTEKVSELRCRVLDLPLPEPSPQISQ